MTQLFSPITIRGIKLKNRIVLSPMAMSRAELNGQVNDWHFVHYGSRAMGGSGLILLEVTAVNPEGRLGLNDLGLWQDDQIEPLDRLVKFMHSMDTAVGIQLSHGGRKAWINPDRTTPYRLVAPSELSFRSDDPLPHALTKNEIHEIIQQWQAAAMRADQAGFDIVEIHAAHGFLIHQFLSPLSNIRDDEYGGSPENRMRILVEVVQAIRKAWPEKKALFVRGSITDWSEGGLSVEDWVTIAQTIKPWGVDLLECSSGGLIKSQKPMLGPGYNVPFAQAIREITPISTGAVGLITNPELADEIINNQHADLVVMGRELLRNPYWPLTAAKSLGQKVVWPREYSAAKCN